MNWDRVEGSWKQFKGKVKQEWGKLTDDNLDVIAGNRDVLAGKVQEAYGISKDEAEKQIRKFERPLRRLDAGGHASAVVGRSPRTSDAPLQGMMKRRKPNRLQAEDVVIGYLQPRHSLLSRSGQALGPRKLPPRTSFGADACIRPIFFGMPTKGPDTKRHRFGPARERAAELGAYVEYAPSRSVTGFVG